MAPPHYVHPFYRIWFTIIDPTVVFLTVLACIFSPETILENSLPPSIEKFSPLSHGPLLHQSAALYFFMGVIFAVLLRASPDPQVWRITQAATLAVDIGLLATMYAMMAQQGRLGVKDWRAGDVGNMGFTVWVAIIRVAYLLGVGAEEPAKSKIR